MATNNRTFNYQVNFNGNASQLKGVISSLRKDLQSLSSKTITFDSGQIQTAVNDVKELKMALDSAVNVNTGKLDLSKFSQQLQASRKTLQDYEVSLSHLGSEGQQAFLKLVKGISQAEIPLKKANALTKTLLASLKNVVTWQISSSLLTGFTSSISNAVNYAKDLNESLNNIRIVSGKSAQEMEVFAEKANKAAKALSTTTAAYADAALIYYQQGLSAKEVEERTAATIKMANVTGEAAESVSSYMTAIWNNFDNGSKSLEYYADVMTALGAATAASTDEIATGLEKFAGIAQTVGLSYEYATSALATLVAETRQSPETVGTALKTIFSRLQGLSLGETLDDGTTLNKYSEALAVVGVNIKNSNGELKKMDDILDNLAQKWNFISKDQQMALAQTVGGVRQYTQLITLMNNWGDMRNNLDTALNAEGALEKQNAIFEQSWEASTKRVRASLEGLWDSVIDDDFFIKFNDAMSGLVDAVGGLLEGFGGIKNILGVITPMVIGKLMPAITNGVQNMTRSLANRTLSNYALTINKESQKVIQEDLSSDNLSEGVRREYEIELELLKIKETELRYGDQLSEKTKEYLNVRKEALELEQKILDKLLEQRKTLEVEAETAVKRSTRGVAGTERRQDIKNEFNDLEQNLDKQNALKKLNLYNTEDSEAYKMSTSAILQSNSQDEITNFVNERLQKINAAVELGSLEDPAFMEDTRTKLQNNQNTIDINKQRIANIDTDIQNKTQEQSTYMATGNEYQQYADAIAARINSGDYKDKQEKNELSKDQSFWAKSAEEEFNKAKNIGTEIDVLSQDKSNLEVEVQNLENTNSQLTESITKFEKLDEDTRKTQQEFFKNLQILIDKMQKGDNLGQEDLNLLQQTENDARRLSENNLLDEEATIDTRLTSELGVDTSNVQNFTEAIEGKMQNTEAIENAKEEAKLKEKIIQEYYAKEKKSADKQHEENKKNIKAEGKEKEKQNKNSSKSESAEEKKRHKEVLNNTRQEQKEKQKTIKTLRKEINELEKEISDDTNVFIDDSFIEDTKKRIEELKQKIAELEQQDPTITVDVDVDDTEVDKVKRDIKEIENKHIKGPKFDVPDNLISKWDITSMKIQDAATALSGVSTLISSIQSLGSIWSNDDLSLVEKYTSSLMSVSMLLGTLSQVYPILTKMVKKNGLEYLFSAQKYKQAKNSENAEAKKTIGFKLAEAFASAGAQAAAGNPAPLATVIAIAAAVAGLVGLISIGNASASQQNKKEQAKKDYSTFTNMAETKQANDEVFAEYKTLYADYKVSGEGKEELAKTAEELAKAYNIEGAALAKLTGNYEDFNKQLKLAKDKENQNLKAQAKQSQISLGATFGDKLETGAGGEWDWWQLIFTLGIPYLLGDTDTYNQTSKSNLMADGSISKDILQGYEDILSFDESTGKIKVKYDATDERANVKYAAFLSEYTQAALASGASQEDLKNDAFYQAAQKKIAALGEDTVNQAVEMNDTLNSLELEEIATNMFGALGEKVPDSIKEMDKMSEAFINQAKAVGISEEAARNYLKVLPDTKDLVNQSESIENMFSGENKDELAERAKDLYDEYGNMVFDSRINLYADDSSISNMIDYIQRELNDQNFYVDLVAKVNLGSKWEKAVASGDMETINEILSDLSQSEQNKLLSMSPEEGRKYLEQRAYQQTSGTFKSTVNANIEQHNKDLQNDVTSASERSAEAADVVTKSQKEYDNRVKDVEAGFGYLETVNLLSSTGGSESAIKEAYDKARKALGEDILDEFTALQTETQYNADGSYVNYRQGYDNTGRKNWYKQSYDSNGKITESWTLHEKGNTEKTVDTSNVDNYTKAEKYRLNVANKEYDDSIKDYDVAVTNMENYFSKASHNMTTEQLKTLSIAANTAETPEQLEILYKTTSKNIGPYWDKLKEFYQNDPLQLQNINDYEKKYKQKLKEREKIEKEYYALQSKNQDKLTEKEQERLKEIEKYLNVTFPKDLKNLEKDYNLILDKSKQLEKNKNFQQDTLGSFSTFESSSNSQYDKDIAKADIMNNVNSYFGMDIVTTDNWEQYYGWIKKGLQGDEEAWNKVLALKNQYLQGQKDEFGNYDFSGLREELKKLSVDYGKVEEAARKAGISMNELYNPDGTINFDVLSKLISNIENIQQAALIAGTLLGAIDDGVPDQIVVDLIINAQVTSWQQELYNTLFTATDSESNAKFYEMLEKRRKSGDISELDYNAIKDTYKSGNTSGALEYIKANIIPAKKEEPDFTEKIKEIYDMFNTFDFDYTYTPQGSGSLQNVEIDLSSTNFYDTTEEIIRLNAELETTKKLAEDAEQALNRMAYNPDEKSDYQKKAEEYRKYIQTQIDLNKDLQKAYQTTSDIWAKKISNLETEKLGQDKDGNAITLEALTKTGFTNIDLLFKDINLSDSLDLKEQKVLEYRLNQINEGLDEWYAEQIKPYQGENLDENTAKSYEEEKEKIAQLKSNSEVAISQILSLLNIAGETRDNLNNAIQEGYTLSETLKNFNLDEIDKKYEKVERDRGLIQAKKEVRLTSLQDKKDITSITEKMKLYADSVNMAGEEYAEATQKLEEYIAAGASEEQLAELRIQTFEKEKAYLESIKEIYSNLSEELNKYNEDIDKSIKKLDSISEITENYISILESLGKRFSLSKTITQTGVLTKLQKANVEIGIKNVQVAKDQRDAQQAIVDSFDKQLEKLDKGSTQYGEMYTAREEAASKLIETEKNLANVTLESITDAVEYYKNQIDVIIENINRKITNNQFTSMEDFDDTYKKAEEANNRYLSQEKQAYELSKLRRSIQKEIDANSPLSANIKLLDVLEDINEIEKKNLEITEYDLKMLNAKHELYKAQIALEEAQNNKSQVRLQRSASGTWNYIFTSDSNKIDDAAQKVEDAQHNIYTQSEEYLKEIQANIITLEKNWIEAIKDIYSDDSLSEEEKKKKINAANKYYTRQLSFYTSELTKTLEITGKTFKDTTLAMTLGLENLDQLENTVLSSINYGISELERNLNELETNTNSSLKNAGFDLSSFAKTVVDLADPDNDKGIVSSFNTIAKKISEACGIISESITDLLEDLQGLNGIQNYDTIVSGSGGKTKTEIIAKMKANSLAWHTASSNKQQDLAKENQQLGALIGAYYDSSTGKWYDTKGGTLLYSTSNSSNSSSGSNSSKGGSSSFNNGSSNNSGGSEYVIADSYDKNTDYQAILNSPTASTAEKAQAEAARNAKIKDLGLNGKKDDYGNIITYSNKYTTLDTGGYTGEWGTEGKLAILHEKELVLNKKDTQNILSAVEIARMLTASAFGNIHTMANVFTVKPIDTSSQVLQQEVHIDASFPGVTSAQEIENALNNIINDVAQYAEIKNL